MLLDNWVKDLSRFLSVDENPPIYLTPKGRIKQRKSVIGTFSSQKNAATGIIDIAMSRTGSLALYGFIGWCGAPTADIGPWRTGKRLGDTSEKGQGAAVWQRMIAIKCIVTKQLRYRCKKWLVKHHLTI